MGNANRQRGAKSGWVRRDAVKIWSDHPPCERADKYLHRAEEAEQRAAAGPEEGRHELLKLAAQWRDLAELARKVARADRSGGE